MKKKKVKLAIVSTHPVHYHTPIFRSLAKCENISIKVFFGCPHGILDNFDKDFLFSFKWDYNIVDGFNYHYLTNLSLNKLSGLNGFCVALNSFYKILKFKPDHVLIFSYTPSFIFFITIFLSLFNIKLILRAETTDIARDRSKVKAFIRRKILKLFYSRFVHFFPIGFNSYNHYLSLGIKKSKLSCVKYSIDVDFFEKQVKKWSPKREKIRKSLGISKKQYVFMYCGKFFEPKNPFLISKALEKIPKEIIKNITFIAVGEGVMRNQFQSECEKLLGNNVIFTGFKNQTEIGMYYSISDTLIIPSKSGETWGLVVNEALQFGLNVLASDKVGSACDLLENGLNGYIFKSNKSSELAKYMRIIMQNKNSNYKFQPPHSSELADKILDFIQIKN